MADEWQLARTSLVRAGVRRAEDFGRFVNDTRYLQPSFFDERAAMPVLLELLPALTDAGLVAAAAAHLRAAVGARRAQPAGRCVPAMAPRSGDAGWQLGDALARAARMDDLPVLLDLTRDARYGLARQMIVHALWRFRKSPLVEPALVPLLTYPAVALHAMSALRRSIGP